MKIKSSYKLILVLTFALLACSKWGGNNPVGVTGGVTAWQNLSSGNDGSSTSSLIGSWRYDSDNYYEILTFYSDGNFSIYINDYGNEETLNGTFSVSGNQLDIYINGIKITFTFSINGNVLTLVNADGDSFTYYKI